LEQVNHVGGRFCDPRAIHLPMPRAVRTKAPTRHKHISKPSRGRSAKESSFLSGWSCQRLILVSFTFITVCGCLAVTFQLSSLQHAVERDGLEHRAATEIQAMATEGRRLPSESSKVADVELPPEIPAQTFASVPPAGPFGPASPADPFAPVLPAEPASALPAEPASALPAEAPVQSWASTETKTENVQAPSRVADMQPPSKLERPVCTSRKGYANNKVRGNDLFGISTSAECQDRCASSDHCTCWSWKIDGFCRIGKGRLGSCTYSGSGDDSSWAFGECKRSLPNRPLHPRPTRRPRIDEMPDQSAGGFSQMDSSSCARDVHVFYYMWYGNMEVDGTWVHWNHPFLPDWHKKSQGNWPTGNHEPDYDDIGSTFWPQLGPYSSRDRHTIRTHLEKMKEASIGVAVLSWYPSTMKDDHGKFDHDELLNKLLEEAGQVGIEVAIHIEPYQGRNAESVRSDVQFIHRRFGNHPALHKRVPTGRHRDWLSAEKKDKPMPVFYLYDSYNQPAKVWAELLTPQGAHSIRNDDADAIVICLWLDENHFGYLNDGGFDGAYTYFASDGFSYGSSVQNWPKMRDQAESLGTFFVPSVGPGYNDEQVRPWNGKNTKSRDAGQYYANMFRRATVLDPPMISITSWNEWHEGTNIEPAVPHSRLQGAAGPSEYEDYGYLGPDGYLYETRNHVQSWGIPHRCTVREAVGRAATAPQSAVTAPGGQATARDSPATMPEMARLGARQRDVPVLIITSRRPKYLKRALESVIVNRGDKPEDFPITCSQDSDNEEVSDIIEAAIERGDVAQHLTYQHDAATAKKNGYTKLATHYRWALGQMFDELGNEQLIILEEDLEISPDFFEYFAATLPLLQADRDLFCVSAWNDNGKADVASDSQALFRSDFFPGLGWMLLKGFWRELKQKWPPAYWDDYVRRPDIRLGRHCIRPEVSRTFTFGEVGVSKGQFYKKHLSHIQLNHQYIKWSSRDLTFLATAEAFDDKLGKEVREAKLLRLEDLIHQIAGPSHSFAIMYEDRSWKRYSHYFGLMEDEKAGIRRGTYRGVLPFTWKGKRIFLVRNWPLRA